MSSSQPGNPRRRRIAGERRGRTLPEEQQSPLTPESPARPESKTPKTPQPKKGAQSEAPVADRPVALDKKASRPSGSTSAAAVTSSGTSSTTSASTASTTSSTTDEPKGDEKKRRSTGWWGSRISLIVMSLVLALLLVLTGLAALGLLGTDGVQDVNKAEAVDRSVRTAPAAAEAAAAAILAYDHDSLDADRDTAARFMTDEFADEYSETFEKVVRPAAEQNQAKVTATVNASSVIRATDDTARVLLFVDQATTSTANDRPQIALNRVEMSMVREGDSWLVDDISSY